MVPDCVHICGHIRALCRHMSALMHVGHMSTYIYTVSTCVEACICLGYGNKMVVDCVDICVHILALCRHMSTLMHVKHMCDICQIMECVDIYIHRVDIIPNDLRMHHERTPCSSLSCLRSYNVSTYVAHMYTYVHICPTYAINVACPTYVGSRMASENMCKTIRRFVLSCECSSNVPVVKAMPWR